MERSGGPSMSLEQQLVAEHGELQRVLEVLRSIPECSGAAESSYTGPDLNKIDVRVRVRLPGKANGKCVRQHCNDEFDTKLKAGLGLLAKVEKMLGPEAVERARQMAPGMDHARTQACTHSLTHSLTHTTTTTSITSTTSTRHVLLERANTSTRPVRMRVQNLSYFSPQPNSCGLPTCTAIL